MYKIFNYNIHDFISFRINTKMPLFFLKDINLPYSYFETDDINEPDIILNIGKFTPDNTNCYVVDHKLYIKKDYIYCAENINGVKFDLEIKGIESPQTNINVNTESRRPKHVIFNAVLAQLAVLRTVIDFKLLCKGVVSIHAAGIAGREGAIIFVGRGGTFKTTFCMDYVRKEGYQFLGDDRVIIKAGKCFSYPIFYKLFDYRLRKMRTENFSLFDKYKALFYVAKRKNMHVPEYMTNEADVSSIYFIAKSPEGGMRAVPLCKEDILHKMINSQKMEDMVSSQFMQFQTGIIYECFMAYSYVFHNSKLAGYWDTYSSVLENNLDVKTCFEIVLPQNYRKDTFQNFTKLIKDLK